MGKSKIDISYRALTIAAALALLSSGCRPAGGTAAKKSDAANAGGVAIAPSSGQVPVILAATAESTSYSLAVRAAASATSSVPVVRGTAFPRHLVTIENQRLVTNQIGTGDRRQSNGSCVGDCRLQVTGRYATFVSSGTLRVIDLETGTERDTLLTLAASATLAIYGNYAVTSTSGFLAVVNLTNGTRRTLNVSMQPGARIAINEGWAATDSNGALIYVNLASGQVTQTNFNVQPGSPLLVSGSFLAALPSNQLVTWDLEKGTRTVTNLTFASTSSFVIAGRYLAMNHQGVLAYVDMRAGRLVRTNIILRDGATIVVSSRFLAANSNGTLALWDMSSGQRVSTSLILSDDARMIASGRYLAVNSYGNLVLVDLSNGYLWRPNRLLQNQSARIFAYREGFVAESSGSLIFLDPIAGTQKTLLSGASAAAQAYRAGRYVALAAANSLLWVIDLQTGSARSISYTVAAGDDLRIAGRYLLLHRANNSSPVGIDLVTGAIRFLYGASATASFLLDTGFSDLEILEEREAASLVATNSASYAWDQIAADSITAVFGVGLARYAGETPSITLAPIGGTVAISVSSVFFATEYQAAFVVPSAIPVGQSLLEFRDRSGLAGFARVSTPKASPGIFTASQDGQGFAVGFSTLDGSSFPPLTNASGQGAPVAFDPANRRPTYLIIYGTGVRGGTATATVGGTTVQVAYAGAVDGYAGLDQINLVLPSTLRNRGAVDVVISSGGQKANAVKVVLGN